MDLSGDLIKNEMGSNFSGGLQEIYTDFDAWITKWSCKFKLRSIAPNRSSFTKQELVDEETKRNVAILEDLLVYGFVKNKMAVIKNIVFKLEPIKTEDYIHLDYVLMRLLNGNKRILLVNSKL